VSDETPSGGPLDIAVLDRCADRAITHPLVEGWTFHPDAMTPRRLELSLDAGQYPQAVATARLDVRWFTDGTYTVQYLETRGDDVWQCRWDRHPKPDAPLAQFHPPPDAGSPVEPSTFETTHPLSVLFDVLDWVAARVTRVH
jgi:hypothetical protein